MTAFTFAVICFVLALVFLIISIFQFREKGFLFNNAYIWATEQERQSMDKSMHYRQSGIAFAFCASIFLVMAMECLLMTGWLWLVDGLLAVGLLVYAVVSSVKCSG